MTDFGRDEIHHRFFYHLHCNGVPPPTWYHEECDPSDGSERGPIIFEFFWVDLRYGVPSLIADHDRMLPQLFDVLRLETM
jgi:8-oxo-dGTP diphosphatase